MSDTNTPDMVGIPSTLDTDAEDVVWALQTAEALWKRNERVDAVVWLRRAAQAAGEAEDDDRALSLARGAAELAEWLAQAVPGTLVPFPSASPPSGEPASADGVEDLLRQSQVGLEVAAPVSVPMSIDLTKDDDEGALETPLMNLAVAEGPDAQVAQVAHVEHVEHPGDAPLLELGVMESIPAPSSEGSSRERAHAVPTGAEAHAGMLDPWADSEKPTRPRDEEVVMPASLPPEALEDAEIVTSAPPTAPAAPIAAPIAAPVAPRRAPPLPPRPGPPLPLRTKPPIPAPRAPAPKAVPIPPPPVEPLAAAPSAIEPPAIEPPAMDPPAMEPPAIEAPPIEAAPPAVAAPPSSVEPPILELSGVEAFADLPDDARDAFARAARVATLSRDEQVAQFALVFVIEGSVDVAATIVDAPAERLAAGVVLRSRGTLDEHRVPMRLICGSDSAKVATWDDAAVAEAFRACSWVEDDLCAAGDRVQALVGLTMGPLGERLDASLRMDVTRRLTLRALAEGEVFARQGAPVPGFLVVGAGELDLVRDDQVEGSIKPGDFLFASEMLGGVPAPATARAGKGGALVMTGDRKLAQELMVTCPPLLEIFAGM